MRKILDLILPKEHTDQSGPEPSTKNGRFFPWEIRGTYKKKKIIAIFFRRCSI